MNPAWRLAPKNCPVVTSKSFIPFLPEILSCETGPWKWAITLLLLVLIGIPAAPTQAAVRTVPAQYQTIQSAIDACQTGDRVVVSPGTYRENITFRRRAITLTSTDPRDPATVSNTVISAVGKRSAVSFTTAEKSNSVITGFTITGGYGTARVLDGTTNYYGGGIYCFRSSPTIVGNIITGNHAPAEPALLGYGGGIACIEADPTISRNFIAGNSAFSGGGIMMLLGHARVTDTIIVSNSATVGGGVMMQSGGQLANNTLVGNSASAGGNAYVFSDVSGQSILTDNILVNATAGGGLSLEPADLFTQTTSNNVWNNTGGDYSEGTDQTSFNGNISQDPKFVDPTLGDYRLQDSSPCINTGHSGFQRSSEELDFYGNSRVYARQVDMGAAEYFDNFRPLANAGADQIVGATLLPFLVTLDGSGSTDPNSAALSYHWQQLSGPNVVLTEPTAMRPTISLPALGTYVFALVVENEGFSSFRDTVEIIAKNEAPTAHAGNDLSVTNLSEGTIITLDGTQSFDPENVQLRYHWQQIDGWKIQLSDTNASQPTLLLPWPGLYHFSLVVDDGMKQSEPAIVAVGIGPNHAPVADAGPSRYLPSGSMILDGTRSFDPDGYGTLTYQWRQISGPVAKMNGTNTPKPVLSGFVARATNQVCVFELVVSDGYLASTPSLTTVTVVKSFGVNALSLSNPPFDPTKPTIVAFGGGDCSTGGGMFFGGVWEERANWVSVNSYAAPYFQYGDMIITYLSSVAPDYHQPIQTMGHSTGNLPAMEAAWHINSTYKDARYTVNRVSLLDAVCGSLTSLVNRFHTNRVDGEQCWVDNYVSYDPNYPAATILPGAMNVVCKPPQNHSYPPIRYRASSLDYEPNGLTPFGYVSVIGAGANFQLNTASQKYYMSIEADGSLAFFDESKFPGKLLAPVELSGPADGAILSPSGAVLGCEPVSNATRYQFLVGSAPDRVMDFTVVVETPAPPSHRLETLPHPDSWWTVRAIDSFGSSIYATPRRIRLPGNRPPIANPGPGQNVLVGSDGLAKVTLDALASTDPDGDPLRFTWAWTSGGRAYLSNNARVTIELPVGSHVVQLMVSDGKLNSAIVEATITVSSDAVPSLSIERNGDQVNLRWTAPAFSLQSAPAVGGPFTDVDGATTGYKVPAANSQQFFRLRN